MYKSHYVKESTAEKFLYKTYANKLTKIKNLAKKIIIITSFQCLESNLKKIWEILRSLLPCKQNPSFTNSLTVNDAEIVDPKEMSEQFRGAESQTWARGQLKYWAPLYFNATL